MSDSRFKRLCLRLCVIGLAGLLSASLPSCVRGGRRFKDAEKCAKRFEDPKRDKWQRPDYVLSLLDLAADSKVGDIGSATGYFPVRFARACPDGMIYGVDVEPDMVRYLNDRAANEGLYNLKSNLCLPDDPKLPEPVDLIFICNTYHHLSDRTAYFRRCRSLLRPGGRIVSVDWYNRKQAVGPPPDHTLAADVAIQEMADAGYTLVNRDTTLPYQYILVFEPQDAGE